MSLITYLMPIVAIALGVVVRGEVIEVRSIVGAGVILLGVGLVSQPLRAPRDGSGVPATVPEPASGVPAIATEPASAFGRLRRSAGVGVRAQRSDRPGAGSARPPGGTPPRR